MRKDDLDFIKESLGLKDGEVYTSMPGALINPKDFYGPNDACFILYVPGKNEDIEWQDIYRRIAQHFFGWNTGS